VRTLVTGASGFLGSHVVELLQERGEATRALVRSGEDTRAVERSGAELCIGDLRDRPSLIRAVQGVDRVLHCAARTGPWGIDREYHLDNVLGLRTLAEAALDAGVERFVHVSSISVHGNDVGGEADENAPLARQSDPYSRSKVAGERLLAELIRTRRAPITIVRPGLIYGPRDAASFGRFAELLLRGKMIRIGSGRNHLPLIHARDVARGIILASTVPAALGRTYLLVNDEPVTQRQYFAAIAAELGVREPRRTIPYGVALGLAATAEMVGRITKRPPPLTRFGVQLLGGENRFIMTRARRELGFEPETNLAEGVRESVAWLRSTHAVQEAVAA
jgi:2-alkyl-3-oxoalkanoate reductase